jgi:two-component system response regulator FlrC
MPQLLLIVEDNVQVREMLEMLVAVWGYHARGVSTADAALPHLERGDIAVVLADLHLPGRNGVELLAEVRERFPEVRVALMTGEPNGSAALRRATALGLPVLRKPFDPQRLEALLLSFARGAEP